MRQFAFNRLWATFYILGSLMFTVVLWAITIGPEANDRSLPAWMKLVFGLLTVLIYYLAARTIASSATIYESGIAYRTLGKRGEMMWQEIDKFRYSVVKTYHQGIIPTTQYTITLIDAAGNKAELGSNVQQPKDLGKILWDKLHPMLRDKMMAQLNVHQAIELGRVRLVDQGVEINPPIGKITFVPNERLAGCTLNNGMLTIIESVNGNQKKHAVMLNNIYNVFPLIEILNSRMRVPNASVATMGTDNRDKQKGALPSSGARLST